MLMKQLNDNLNEIDKLNGDNKSQRNSTKLNESQRNLTVLNENQREDDPRFAGNLTAEIRNWVKESSGSFAVADLDREFGLTSRRDKQRRSTALRKIYKENLIEKDRRVVGKYHIVAGDIKFYDLEAAEPEPLKISLPLGLSELVNIPKRSIIVFAGATNAGKTTLCLNTLYSNLGSTPLIYVASEMGPGLFNERVEPFGLTVSEWNKGLKFTDDFSNFSGIIRHHNNGGLAVLDFLEEIGGEFYKIPSDIRRAYDSLDNGVCIICIQKRSNSLYARGGEGTAEKAQLYVALDCLLHKPNFTISSARIVKAKAYSGRNPNGLERHFRIRGGWQIEPVNDWQYINEQQRAAMVATYERYER